MSEKKTIINIDRNIMIYVYNVWKPTKKVADDHNLKINSISSVVYFFKKNVRIKRSHCSPYKLIE